MAKNQAQQDFEARQSNLLPFPSGNDAATDGDTRLYSVKDIQEEFKVGNKQARNYAAIVKEAYPWLSPDLKNGQKYSQLLVEKIREFKASGLSASEWVAKVHGENSDKIQQPQSQPEQSTEVTAGLALIPDDSPFSGLTVTTKATQKRELLQAELVATEGEVDSDFADFLALSTEIMAEDEAFTDQDELEWQVLRKRNAQKWLKRRAILERDKQQILQGDVPLPKSSKSV